MGYGRKIITTDARMITSENVIAEVQKAFLVHSENRNDIQKLWDIYRNKTAILKKEKEIRENINHKIGENRAYEIVSFHKGYTFGEPIQYVRRERASQASGEDDVLASEINALNGHMASARKAACDNAIAEWMYVAGTGYRLTLPNPRWKKDEVDESPLALYSLDPRNTFVVYSSDVTRRPVMSVYYVTKEDNSLVFSVYTENRYFELSNNSTIVYETAHPLGMNPITEYPAELARLGVFEIVVPLLDALNELQSNRMDDIVQFVNSFLALVGAQIDDDTYKKLQELKMLCLPEGTDAKYLSVAMVQTDVQTLKDDLIQAIYEICGVPNRNGGSSTSDTGAGVQLRDGWQSAETRAKATELMFKESEDTFLRLALRILRDTVGTKLRITDITPHFTRRNYENIQSKSQVLVTMLSNPKLHPELAFTACGLFVDPESAYLQSKAWWEEQEQKEAAEMEKYVKSLGDESGGEDE